MLSEPGRTQGDLNFGLFGFPVRVHPMFWLVGALLGYSLRSLPEVLIWILALFLSILCHELGHAIVMRALGLRPAIILYGMGGLTVSNGSRNYATTRLTRGRDILISLAGPVAGFLLAAALAGVIVLSGHRDNLFLVHWRGIPLPQVALDSVRLTQLIDDLFYICVFWGLVNLLPILPLDGGHVARTVLMVVNPAGGYRQSLLLSILVAGGLAVVGAAQWHDWFVAIFFGVLAYESLTMLQADTGQRLW